MSGKDNTVNQMSGKDNTVNQMSGEDNTVNQMSGKDNTVNQMSDKDNAVNQMSGKDNAVNQMSGKDNTVNQMSGKDNTVHQMSGKDNTVKKFQVRPIQSIKCLLIGCGWTDLQIESRYSGCKDKIFKHYKTEPCCRSTFELLTKYYQRQLSSSMPIHRNIRKENKDPESTCQQAVNYPKRYWGIPTMCNTVIIVFGAKIAIALSR